MHKLLFYILILINIIYTYQYIADINYIKLKPKKQRSAINSKRVQTKGRKEKIHIRAQTANLTCKAAGRQTHRHQEIER